MKTYVLSALLFFYVLCMVACERVETAQIKLLGQTPIYSIHSVHYPIDRSFDAIPYDEQANEPITLLNEDGSVRATRSISFECPSCHKPIGYKQRVCKRCEIDKFIWPQTVKCTYCRGTGQCAADLRLHQENGICYQCKGTGYNEFERYREIEGQDKPALCPVCKGSGKCMICQGTAKCDVCTGEGSLSLEYVDRIRVPNIIGIIGASRKIKEEMDSQKRSEERERAMEEQRKEKEKEESSDTDKAKEDKETDE